MKTETSLDTKGDIDLNRVDVATPGININALIKDKSFENAKTVIVKPRGKAQCNDCKHFFEIKTYLLDCPKCNSYNTIIISGNELRVKTFLYE